MDKGAELYWRYLDGEDEAADELMREYYKNLIMYINNITGNFHAAEEIAIEVFVKIFEDKPRFFKRNASFKTWLFTIGRNLALNYIRDNAKFADISVYELFQHGYETDIEKEYLKSEDKTILHKAMSGLNADYKQVLYLVFFEGFSNEEASKVMKKSKRQIENLIYRAKNALKNQLEKEGYSYEEF